MTDLHAPITLGSATAANRIALAAVPVVAVGGIWTPQDARQVLDLGADVVPIGRAAIDDPDWFGSRRRPGPALSAGRRPPTWPRPMPPSGLRAGPGGGVRAAPGREGVTSPRR